MEILILSLCSFKANKKQKERIPFIASRIVYPRQISHFARLYVLTRYLGTAYESGDYETDFAIARVDLIKGSMDADKPSYLTEMKKAFYELAVTDENIQKLIIDFSYDELPETLRVSISKEVFQQLTTTYAVFKKLTVDFVYGELLIALRSGIAPDDKLRFPILDFISSVTKKYIVLYAVLKKVDFTQDREFQAIYGNLAKQSTSSKEKRQKLTDIRTEAVKILIAQADAALKEMHRKRIDYEEMKRFWDRFQNNLMLVTTYSISDETLASLLDWMDFHKEGFFGLFYRNLVFINNCINKDKEEVRQEREHQRWTVVKWIEKHPNQVFIKEFLSAVFTYENYTPILDEVLAYLDDIEKKKGEAARIELKIPSSSINSERYDNHYRKPQNNGGRIAKLLITEEDKKACLALAAQIKLRGVSLVIRTAFDRGTLDALVDTTNKAFILQEIDRDTVAEIKRTIGNRDAITAKKIYTPGVCESDLIREENAPTEQQEQTLATLVRRIEASPAAHLIKR